MTVWLHRAHDSNQETHPHKPRVGHPQNTLAREKGPAAENKTRTLRKKREGCGTREIFTGL